MQRQMVVETLLLVLFYRTFWTLFLEPLSDSPSRGGYASVMEAFGRISQHFPSWFTGNGMSTRLPMRWCCAACEPCSGVWRMPVWEQAEDINSECFSCLGSWSSRTRLPESIHTQLYGTTCDILESIHQVRAPPAQWAELEVPLRAAVRDGDVLLADDREANMAWCVDRQELFSYLIPAWASGKRCLHTPPHQVDLWSS